jgi:hypothetical protein
LTVAFTDSKKSKIKSLATHIFDSFKMFLVSNTLHGLFILLHCPFNSNWSDVCSDVHILTQGTFWPWSLSWIYILWPPLLSRPCPGRGDGEQLWVWGMEGSGQHFVQKVVLTLLGERVGLGRVAPRLGDGRSKTFVGTQCLSKVTLLFWVDTTKTLKPCAKQHFMKNLWSKKNKLHIFLQELIFSKNFIHNIFLSNMTLKIYLSKILHIIFFWVIWH